MPVPPFRRLEAIACLIKAAIAVVATSTVACTAATSDESWVEPSPHALSQSDGNPCAFQDPGPAGTVNEKSFVVKLPKGVGIDSVAAGATAGGLAIGTKAKVLAETTGYAAVSNVESSLRLEVGSKAETGDVFSETSGVKLRERSHVHGSVRTAGTILREEGALIDGQSVPGTSLRPLEVFTWTVAFPGSNRGDCSFDNGQLSLEPGAYGAISLGAHSLLEVRAGQYHFKSLSIGDGAVIEADDSDGPVIFYVEGSFNSGGEIIPVALDGPGVFIGVAGSMADVHGRFGGFLVAPWANVTLNSGSGELNGAFFGNVVSLTNASVIRHRGQTTEQFCDVQTASSCSTRCPCPTGGICSSDAQCQAGLFCWGIQAGSGVCQPINVDDGNPCTLDRYDPAGGVLHEPHPAGTSCADQNVCNGLEECDAAGHCLAGAPPAIDDANPCTIDECTPELGIVHRPAPTGSSCADETLCNGAEQCDGAGHCSPGTPPSVEDGNPCTADLCDPLSGVSHPALPQGTSCADENPCNGQEACDGAGVCTAGLMLPVDDANPCTQDWCDPASGVQHKPLSAGTSCADADHCNGDETCNGSGSCIAGSPSLVDDGNPCTLDACDPATGTTHTPYPVNTLCDNDNVCDGVNRCDGNGACLAAEPPDVDDDNPCTVDSCDPEDGVRHSPAVPGTGCGDGDPCNGDELCSADASCGSGVAPELDDENPCTVDSCDSAVGVLHLPVAPGTHCGDADLCNGDEVCDAAGSCLPALPPGLDDGNPCTTDSCDPTLGVRHDPVLPGTSCGDGDACDGDELCDASAACQPGQAPEVDDDNVCTIDVCDPASGVINAPAPAGASCSDGQACNGSELCDGAGVCLAGGELDLLSISSPSSGTLTRDSQVTISGTSRASAAVVITVEPGGVSTTLPGSGELESFSLVVPLVEGQNQFTISADDANGCGETAELSLTRDSTPPSIGISAPEGLALSSTGQALVSASDSGGVVEVRLISSLGDQIVSEQALAAPPYSFQIVVPADASAGDSLLLSATALDPAGNVGQTSASVVITADALVVGRVLSDTLGQAIGGARVSVGARQATARADGRYSLSPEADIEAVVRVWSRGFTSVDRRTPLALGVGSIAVDARLTPLAEPVLISGDDVVIGGELARWDDHGIEADLGVPASAFSRPVAVHFTPLSPQGLPALLPPGWSPVASFEIRLAADDPNSPELDAEASFEPIAQPLTLALHGLPAGPLAFVAHDRAARDWRVIDELFPETGEISLTLGGLGAFAVIIPDASSAPSIPAPGALLAGLESQPLPLTAIAESSAVPDSLPSAGGVAQGRIVLTGASSLPSGTVIAAAFSEQYALGSGFTASTETRLQDLVLYRAQVPAVAGIDPELASRIGASFPVVPSFAFGPAELGSGNVHVELLGGREAHRGKIGGLAPAVVDHAGATLTVLPGSLDADTVVDIERTPIAGFAFQSNELAPVAQVAIDLSGAVLNQGAELALAGLPLALEDTPLLARLERSTDGIARPFIVALGSYDGAEWIFTDSDGLGGITREGSYVVYRATLPLGFVAGTTRAASAPIQALVSVADLPFVAPSALDGSYKIPVRPGEAALSARVPGTNLAAHDTVSVSLGTTSALDLDLVGEVTTASVSPADGTFAVPRSTQVELTTPIALDATTVSEDNIKLFAGDPSENLLVDVRLQLSANGQSLAIIPELRLDAATTYTLQASGLRDTLGGIVVVPVTTFRTAAEAPPAIDTNQVEVTLDDDGNAVVSAAPGTFAPGTVVIIANQGNGQVTSCSVDNSGGLACTIPASIDDTLIISITDPDGSTITLERGQYKLPDGRTAVGTAGGVVTGPGGVELRIPEGALDDAATFTITILGPDAFAERPGLPDVEFGGVLRIDSPEMPEFRKEVDLAFPRPAAAPDGSFFYVYRRLEDQQSGAVAFEVIDHAFPESADLSAKVVTASPPFPGVQDSRSISLSSAGNLFVPSVTTMYLMQWGYDPERRHNSSANAVHGKVSQTQWTSNQGSASAPTFVPVSGALVGFVDESGVVTFASTSTPSPTIAKTTDEGTFALWHPTTTQGKVRVAAVRQNVPGSASSMCPEVPSSSYSIQCTTAFLGGPLSTTTIYPSLQAYASIAEANLLFPPQQPDIDVEPLIDITILRRVDGHNQFSNGIVAEGEEVVLQFHADGADVRAASIVHQDLSTELNLLADPLAAHPGDKLATYAPTAAGAYTVKASALPAFGSPISASVTFRVIAAGGGVTQPLAHEAPAVIAGQTSPGADASCISPSVFPSIVFTEPVTNLPGNVLLLEPSDVPGQDPVRVPLSLSGITPAGEPVVIGDVGAGLVVTSITIEPLRRLKFGTEYTLVLDSEIKDTVDPDVSDDVQLALVAYESRFRTLEPETLPPLATGFSSAGIVALGERVYVAQHSSPHAILRTFDVANPGDVVELTTAQRSMLGRPMDLDAELDANGDARVIVATGPNDTSLPSNLRLYRILRGSPATAQWIGAASLTTTAVEGIVRRVAMRGNFAYTISTQKGVQVVDLGKAEDEFRAEGGDSAAVRLALNTDGRGFAHEAVVATIPVTGRSSQPAFLADLKVADLLDGFVQPVLAVTGALSLVLINPQTGDTLFSAAQTPDDGFRGRALDVGKIDGRDVIVIVGEKSGLPTMRIVEVSDPRNPTTLGETTLAERPLDVVLREGAALVSSAESLQVVYLDRQPGIGIVKTTKAGTVAGIGGRLALLDSGLVLSAGVSVAGEPIPVDGIRAATLEPLPVILPIRPPTAKRLVSGAITELETLIRSEVNVVVFAGCGTPQDASLVLDRVNRQSPADPGTFVREWTVPLQSSANMYTGRVPLLEHEIYPDTDASGEMRRLTFKVPTSAGGTRQARRELPIRTFDLRVDSNNDTVLSDWRTPADDADEAAVRDGERFSFWLSDSSDPVQPLEDWAVVRLRLPYLPNENDKIFLTWPNGDWSLVKTTAPGLDYLKFNMAPRVADVIHGSDSPSLEGRIEIPRDWLVQGENTFLARFNGQISAGLSTPFGDGANAKILLSYQPENLQPLLLQEVLVEIRPIEEWASLYTARPDSTSGTPTPFSPLAEFRAVPEWTPVPSDVTDITVVVHGFNIPAAGAANFTSSYLKRLYWGGHPVLRPQPTAGPGRVPWVVGISWPGDAGPVLPSSLPFVGGTPLLQVPGVPDSMALLSLFYLPVDEFHAFQTGVPLAALLKDLKGNDRRINVVAHSLGNMVVNSALQQPDMSGVVDAYVMNQAAFSLEAFGSFPVDGELAAQAEQQGYPSDATWMAQWTQINQQHCGQDDCHEECPNEAPVDPTDDFERWCAKRALADQEARPLYDQRWTKYAQRGNRPWQGVFHDNVNRTAIFNSYYQGDFVLNMLLMLSWSRQKPSLGVAAALGGDLDLLGVHPFGIHKDSRERMFWADLDEDLAQQEYLWMAVDPGNTHHAPITREWAELAYYFGPLARPLGSNNLPLLGARNLDMSSRITGFDVTFKPNWVNVLLTLTDSVMDAVLDDLAPDTDPIFLQLAEEMQAYPELAPYGAEIISRISLVPPADANDAAAIAGRAAVVAGIVWDVVKDVLLQFKDEIEGSHGYMTSGKVGDVWCAYELLADVYSTGQQGECSKQE